MATLAKEIQFVDLCPRCKYSLILLSKSVNYPGNANFKSRQFTSLHERQHTVGPFVRLKILSSDRRLSCCCFFYISRCINCYGQEYSVKACVRMALRPTSVYIDGDIKLLYIFHFSLSFILYHFISHYILFTHNKSNCMTSFKTIISRRLFTFFTWR